MYEETGLETLSIRRDRSILLFFHEILNSNNPAYLAELKPELNEVRHQRNLRYNDNFSIPICRINKYKNSFLPTASTLWNELHADAKNITCSDVFKRHLEETISSPNPVFNLGERKFNIMSKLRKKRSNLNGDLFLVKRTNDPRCKCGYFLKMLIIFFLYLPTIFRRKDCPT